MTRKTKEQISYNMSRVLAKGSVIEKTLGKALWKKGFRYRKHYDKLIGKPDFVFIKYKMVIFCDSEFWHGKDWEVKKGEIKSHKEFWYKKIQNNIARDIAVNKVLKKNGWKVLRFWGKEIKNKMPYCIAKIEKAINERKNGKTI